MADFIPASDDDFNQLVENLNNSVTDLSNPLKLTPEQVSRFSNAFAGWGTAWTTWQGIGPEVQAKMNAKVGARATLEDSARAINGSVQADPQVSDETKAAADLPVHKTTRTPVGEIETAPMLQRLENEHLLQRLWFVDSATPTSKARPAGAAFCEIRQQIVAAGGPAPLDPGAMPFLATDSKAPHRADLEASEIGQTAYYAFRWVNTRQQPGPWSAITGYLIN